MKYLRKLTPTERERFYIKIDSEHRSMFPKMNVQFNLIVKEQAFEVRIDRQKRLWGYKFRSLIDFSSESVLEITKEEYDVYHLTQIKQK